MIKVEDLQTQKLIRSLPVGVKITIIYCHLGVLCLNFDCPTNGILPCDTCFYCSAVHCESARPTASTPLCISLQQKNRCKIRQVCTVSYIYTHACAQNIYDRWETLLFFGHLSLGKNLTSHDFPPFFYGFNTSTGQAAISCIHTMLIEPWGREAARFKCSDDFAQRGLDPCWIQFPFSSLFSMKFHRLIFRIEIAPVLKCLMSLY